MQVRVLLLVLVLLMREKGVMRVHDNGGPHATRTTAHNAAKRLVVRRDHDGVPASSRPQGRGGDGQRLRVVVVRVGVLRLRVVVQRSPCCVDCDGSVVGVRIRRRRRRVVGYYRGGVLLSPLRQHGPVVRCPASVREEVTVHPTHSNNRR